MTKKSFKKFMKIFTKREAESKFSKEILDAQMYFQDENLILRLNP